MQEHEALALPVAAVLVAVDLTVHSQVTVSQSGLLASTLVRFWPVYNSGQGVSSETVITN